MVYNTVVSIHCIFISKEILRCLFLLVELYVLQSNLLFYVVHELLDSEGGRNFKMVKYVPLFPQKYITLFRICNNFVQKNLYMVEVK